MPVAPARTTSRTTRRTLTATAAVVAVAALTTVAPALADQESGRDDSARGGAGPAPSKVVYRYQGDDIDNLDLCAFNPRLQQTVTAPRPGFLEVTGQVTAARDVDAVGDGLLRAFLTVRGRTASQVGQVALTRDGDGDGHVSVTGVVAVPRGRSTVALVLAECGPGAAFVSERSLTATYHQNGNISAGIEDRRPAATSENG